jgi:hypothetical protein
LVLSASRALTYLELTREPAFNVLLKILDCDVDSREYYGLPNSIHSIADLRKPATQRAKHEHTVKNYGVSNGR